MLVFFVPQFPYFGGVEIPEDSSSGGPRDVQTCCEFICKFSGLSTTVIYSYSLELLVGIKLHILYSQIRDFIKYIQMACSLKNITRSF